MSGARFAASRAAVKIAVLGGLLETIVAACSGSDGTPIDTNACGVGVNPLGCVGTDAGQDTSIEVDAPPAADGGDLDARPADSSQGTDANNIDSGLPSDLCPQDDGGVQTVIVADCNPNHDCNSADGLYQRCIEASCSDASTDPIPKLYSTNRVRYVIRTPLHPGFDANCATCGSNSFAYAIAFEVGGSTQVLYQVSVEPPWTIYLMDVVDVFGRTQLKRCSDEMTENVGNLYHSREPVRDQWFLVAATDPNAPARNINVDFN